MKSVPSLGHANYLSDQNLLKRLAFAKHCYPRINLLKEMVRLLGITRGQSDKKIIDVGCGNGQNLIQIRKTGLGANWWALISLRVFCKLLKNPTN